MKNWYSKYLIVYEKPFSEIPAGVISEVKDKLKKQQNSNPLASVVVLAYNEEKRLLSCLWSLSEAICKYPIEIIGVNNNSKDRSEDIFKELDLPYYNEIRQGPGYARNCGLQNAKGKYYICIDGDTIYPPNYLQILIDNLEQPGVVAVSSLWSYLPDKQHSWLGIKMYEFFRDKYLFLQSVNRPELTVRGLVFGHLTEFGRKIGYRVDIRRGEDGSMALELKKYGKILFIKNRKAIPVTGYGTLNLDGSFFNSFRKRFIKGIKNLKNLFTKQSVYIDDEENLIK